MRNNEQMTAIAKQVVADTLREIVARISDKKATGKGFGVKPILLDIIEYLDSTVVKPPYVTGIDDGYVLDVESNLEWSINGGKWSHDPTPLKDGDTIVLRLTGSSEDAKHEPA